MKGNKKDLEAAVESLNESAGLVKNPEYSTKDAYVLDWAYGGVELHQYIGKNGAIRDVFRCGHVPKKELFGLINAFMSCGNNKG